MEQGRREAVIRYVIVAAVTLVALWFLWRNAEQIFFALSVNPYR